jgi:hypothetical protein
LTTGERIFIKSDIRAFYNKLLSRLNFYFNDHLDVTLFFLFKQHQPIDLCKGDALSFSKLGTEILLRILVAMTTSGQHILCCEGRVIVRPICL